MVKWSLSRRDINAMSAFTDIHWSKSKSGPYLGENLPYLHIKFEDYITHVKVIVILENLLICIIVAMATAIYMDTGVCPHGKNYSE